MKQIYLGRHVYGLAAIGFGLTTLVWRDFNIWQQIRALGNVPHREILVYIAAAIELAGGLAIQWRKTARAGAFVLGALYLTFALLWVPHILATPRIYDRWGNFFEAIFSSLGRAHRLRDGWKGFGARHKGGSHRVCILWSVRDFIHTRAASSSFWNGTVRSEVDCSMTTVLGGNHTIPFALAAIALLPPVSSAGISISYPDADWLCAACVVAGAVCRSAQPGQLGRQRAESGDNRRGMDCHGLSKPTSRSRSAIKAIGAALAIK